MKILSVIFFSSFKFAMTFPLAIMVYKMGFWKTLLWINTGGILGIFFFTYLSKGVLIIWNGFRSKYFRTGKKKTTKTKKKFTRKNRIIIRIKNNYGMLGIAIANPILLSIPVGVFLAQRYYANRPSRFLYMIIANAVWSVLYGVFYMYIYQHLPVS